MTDRLYQILFLRELEVDIEKEIKVTEMSRNQKTHGEEAVGKRHESVETKKLSGKRRTWEGAGRGLRSRNRQWLIWCHGCLLLRHQQVMASIDRE